MVCEGETFSVGSRRERGKAGRGGVGRAPSEKAGDVPYSAGV
jgi:hypothetical protein